MGSHHESHHSCHVHPEPTYNKAFLIAIIANGLFVISQIIIAYLSHSTSLLADAVHNLGDVLSLVVAWISQHLLKRRPSDTTTYGMKKTTILAALFNGGLLIFTCGIIVSEAIYHLLEPTSVAALSVMSIAAVGIFINAITALFFLSGSDDLNIRAVFWHLMVDALISAGVVVSSALLYWTGWLWLDPLVGLLIAIIILKGTWSLFSDSFRLIIDGVPEGIILGRVHALLSHQPGVQGVHDLHVWALSTQENALSVHLWMPEEPLTDQARQNLSHVLREQYHIHHSTIQVERVDSFCQDRCTSYL